MPSRWGVEVFDVALSDRNGTLEFVDGAMSSVFSTVENASSYSISSERRVCECRRQAAGPLAVVFEHESDLALADAIERTLKDKFDWEDYWRSVEEHLRPHWPGEVARRYLEVLANARKSHKPKCL
jgi:hypothetical protein